jgi:hypothetical protein
MPEYIYRWTEDGRGPYEVKGSAICIFRANIMIGHKREGVNGQILTAEGQPVDRDMFFENCTFDLGIEMPPKEKDTRSELEVRKEVLRRMLPKGNAIAVMLRRSKSLKKSFTLLHVNKSGRIADITGAAMRVCGLTSRQFWTKTGHGYNHGRSCVEDLALALYDDEQALLYYSA